MFKADDYSDPLKPVTNVPRQIASVVPPFNNRLDAWIAGDDYLPGWIFYGPYGVGKTGAAIEILRYVGKALKLRGRYDKVSTIMATVKETYSDDSNMHERQVVEQYASYNLLVIDEIGSQYGTEAERRIMEWLFILRYEAMRPTIFTTNLDPTTPEGRARLTECLGERVVARLKDWTVDAGQWGGNIRDQQMS